MELAVSSCHSTITKLKQMIESSYTQLRSLEIPQGGNFSLYRQMQLLKHRIQDDIAFNKYNLQMAQNALMKAMQQLKTANIEHEKFKYLEMSEIEKFLKAQKLKESKALDEVALMMFNNK